MFVYTSFYIFMKFCIEQNQMVDCMYTVYVYPVVAMPVILHFIIHGMYDNNEVRFHIFPCALLLLPLASYVIVLTNVNLVYSKFLFIIDSLK